MVQVHAIVEQFQAHILDMMGAQDVEGKTAELGENVRIGSDAGLVFPQRHIPDMVIAVLDAPVPADTRTELLSLQRRGGDVERCLVVGWSALGLGIKDQAMPVNFDHRLSQRPLVGVSQAGLGEDLDLAALDPVAGSGRGLLIDIRRALRLRSRLTILEQRWLILLHLHDGLVTGLVGCFQRLFLAVQAFVST